MTISPDQPERAPDPLIDPAGLSRAQLAGKACASCGKRWPRPRRPLGVTPDGARLKICDDCHPLLEPT